MKGRPSGYRVKAGTGASYNGGEHWRRILGRCDDWERLWGVAFEMRREMRLLCTYRQETHLLFQTEYTR